MSDGFRTSVPEASDVELNSPSFPTAPDTQTALEQLKSEASQATGKIVGPWVWNARQQDQWASLYYENPSMGDDSPFYHPVSLTYFSVSFSNQNNSVECDIEFYKNGTNGGSLFDIIEVRNSQVAYFNELDIQYNQGDRMFMRIEDRGTNTNNPFIVLMARLRGEFTGSGSIVDA